jgi:hypothetical protein
MTNDPKHPRRPDEPPVSDKPEDAGTPDASAESKRSGRVSFDSRGNSVWEWQLETGVYSRDVNTQKLKKLDLGDLSIAETGIQKIPPGLNDKDDARPGGGFNPYDSAPRSKQEGFNPYDNARALGAKLAPKPPEPQQQRPPPRSPEELRKLSDWIKMKKNLDKDKK